MFPKSRFLRSSVIGRFKILHGVARTVDDTPANWIRDQRRSRQSETRFSPAVHMEQPPRCAFIMKGENYFVVMKCKPLSIISDG